MRFLIAESAPPEARRQRRESVGRSFGETYLAILRRLAPDAACDWITPSDADVDLPAGAHLAGYDAVFLTGSPLHFYDATPETRRAVAFMRAVFASGTPAFGSCAGLQVATVAAGGTVRTNRRGHEAAFARRIVPTQAGSAHPLLRGRPAAFDAPCIHSDEVDTLPADAVRLAGNAITAVQAAEIRYESGTFWGVQYHPEIDLYEVAAAVRRQAGSLVEAGFGLSRDDVEAHAARIEALHREPDRRDLAWQLGLDGQVTEGALRRTEMRNFVERLVVPTRALRR